MRLYTLCTPSRSTFKDEWFLHTLQDSLDVICATDSRHIEAPAYGSVEFNRLMQTKVDLLVDAIRDNWGDVFVYSDIDVQFFAPFADQISMLLANHDLVVQRDSPQGHLCAGFMILRAGLKMLNLWQTIGQGLRESACTTDDQALLNRYLLKHGVPQERQGHSYDLLVTRAWTLSGKKFESLPLIRNDYDISWQYLPPSFFGGGTESGQQWKPGDDLLIPEPAVMHHANWTVNIEDKIEQLRFVRQAYESRRTQLTESG